MLAGRLGDIDELNVRFEDSQTSMVFAGLAAGLLPTLMAGMKSRGVLIHGFANTMRLVTHHDFKAAQVDRVVDAFKDFFHRQPKTAAG